MKLNSLFILLLFTIIGNAQNNDWRIAKHTSSLDDVERVVLPLQNNDVLLEQEMDRRAPGIAPRFAVDVSVNITPQTHGTWDETPSGKAVWRLKIHSKDAKSLNLGFTKYFMPAGGILVIYSTDQKTIRGPFSPADNEEHEQLWTPIFPADELVIEVQVPAQNKSQLELELTSINHDFLGFGSVVSGSCNLDVICGAADGYDIVDNYRDIIQSVAVIGMNGGTFCTGFLINNARMDCTPYFMTAAHCGINNGNAASLVAYWNFESPDCREPGSAASGGNGNGQLNDFNTGATFRAGGASSDFTLVEFDDPVSETAEGFFAGWSNETVAPTDTIICVHHPSTDEKRISFEFNNTYFGNWGSGGSNIPSGNHIIIPDWDLGTTEGGSSGSPLFDKNKRVVGQLHGGAAACGNDAYDSYGAIFASWDGGSASSRLKDWLDPDDTGITTLDGVGVSACSFSVDAIQATVAACPGEDAVFALVPSLNFMGDVSLDISGIPANATSTLSINPVAPGDTAYLTISNISALSIDDYLMNVNASDGTNTSFGVLVLSRIDTPAATNLVNPGDGGTNINSNPTYIWEAVPFTDSYYIEIATDIDFNNIIKEAMVSSTAYSSGGLADGTNYYWRVTTTNDCGETISNVSTFMTALDLAISASPGSLTICDSENANFSLSLGSNYAAMGATLSASGLPSGATINFSQNPALPSTPVTASISNLSGTMAGEYTITITADDGTNSNTRNVTLFLETAPLPASLNMPADNATDMALQPQFLWIPSTGADSYTIDIATDIDFTNIVATNTTNITLYNLPDDLEENTLYYWRISAEGECGGSQSLVRTFTTLLIDDVTELNNTLIDIRPNPTNGMLNISLSASLPGNLNVEVYGINGQRLLHQVRTGETQFEISLTDYPSGIYLLKLVNAQSVLTKKIILQR